MLDIDDLGLDTTDRKLLAAIVQKFQSGPVGRPGARRRPRRGDRDRSRTCTSRSCCGSASSTGRPQGRIATEGAAPAPRRAWATRSRRRGARSRTCRRSGTTSRRADRGQPSSRSVASSSSSGSSSPPSALVMVFGSRIPILGHLPGDITIKGDNVTVFIPLGHDARRLDRRLGRPQPARAALTVTGAATLRGPRPAARRRLDAGAARAPDAAPRRRRDARSSCRSAPTRRSRRSTRTRSRTPARRSSSPTPTTCTCGPATSASSASAGCTGSWAGTGRSSPTRAGSRSCRWATCG